MQENFLTYRQCLWLKISLVMGLLLVASYIVYSQGTPPSGRTVVGSLYGMLGLLAIFLLMYYGIRKRKYAQKSWSLQAWLSFHSYIGVLTLLIIVLHAGFQFHADIHTCAFVLLAIVVVSGMVGAFLYLTMPERFRQFGAELMYVGNNTIDMEFNKILQQMQSLAQDKSDAFVRRCAAEIQGSLPARSAGWRLLFRRPPTATALTSRIQEFQAYIDSIPADEHEDFQRLGVLVTQKWELERQLAAQMHVQNLLEAWLYVHLPVAMAMMVAVIAHIVAVFYYGYRVF
jgi:hypothetical protein